jgi:hypothetical protein
MVADAERYQNLVRRLVGGRKVVLAGSPARHWPPAPDR